MRIVVVGDTLLDRDLDGPSTRLCPDAPVPVVDVERASTRAGGAGLVARLLAADGHDTTLVTALGDDGASHELRRCLAGLTVVAGPSGAPTPVKTRVLRSGTPVVRVDEGCAPPPVPVVTPEMLEALADAEAIVVADYGRGLLAHPTVRSALAVAAARLPVVWDPHPRGSDPVPGVTVATPNLAEALGFAGITDASDKTTAAGRAAPALRQAWDVQNVVVTLGGDGAWVQPADDRAGVLVPTGRLAGIDTCGAGDRFASSLAALLAAGTGDLTRAVARAVEATAGFLGAGGVAALEQPGPPDGHHHPDDPGRRSAVDVIRGVREAGGTVVATGGCFDLIHAGHLRTLRAARAMGDALVVCLNSDDSVRRLKGPERPLMSEQDRVELLLGFDVVDAVVVFDEDTPLRILDMLRPDIWVKGGDYIAERLPEHELLAGWGGRCVTVPFHPGRSTTSLADALERVR